MSRRRTIGVLTFVLVCLFVAGWVRSFKGVNDFVLLRGNKHTLNLIISSGNWIGFVTFVADEPVPVWFGTRWVAHFHNDWDKPFDQISENPNWGKNRFHFKVPYFVAVIPLALISCWLLQSKRSKLQSPSHSLQETAR